MMINETTKHIQSLVAAGRSGERRAEGGDRGKSCHPADKMSLYLVQSCSMRTWLPSYTSLPPLHPTLSGWSEYPSAYGSREIGQPLAASLMAQVHHDVKNLQGNGTER